MLHLNCSSSKCTTKLYSFYWKKSSLVKSSAKKTSPALRDILHKPFFGIGRKNDYSTLAKSQKESSDTRYITVDTPDDSVKENESQKEKKHKPLGWFQFLAILIASGALVMYLVSSPLTAGVRGQIMASWLGQSGFIAALSLIFLSEIGDKTFFIAAILAMRLGRWISFAGTILALGFMTILSAMMGACFNAIPDAIKTSLPIGKYLGIALLVFFGISSIKKAIVGGKKNSNDEEDSEYADAEQTVKSAQESGKVHTDGNWKSLVEVMTLIFVAEWGDRSMLATIALGSSQNPVGVAAGGIIGHMIAALIAIFSGSLAATYISERSINATSGILFLVFAIATLFNF